MHAGWTASGEFMPGGGWRDGQNEIISWVVVTQQDFHILQVGLKYQLNGPCHLSKVLCGFLFRRPLGWFLKVPSSLSVAYKHFHGLALHPCPSRSLFGFGNVDPPVRTYCHLLFWLKCLRDTIRSNTEPNDAQIRRP